ncbi:hypothetical protein [Microbacterium sp. KSW4-4]|uniref:hypothetical protein n=1 Tax=Microbacterium sp. KSW4-4 TaxID=2851651 RepID=UPI001FFD94E9|nr:hypothetical protein [Microbacterium sp. KSW4-4]MCK2034462.1 hypothetical protein [Microbacterium sp. KSW4-4]
MNLRVVRDETPALSDDELRERGNDLARKAKRSAVDAVRKSMLSEFFEHGKPITRADLRRWRERAKSAREAWAKVEALTDELLREIEKNSAAARAGKKLKQEGADQ